MRIVGDWFLFDDGESRPILRAKLRTGHGTMVTEQFLLDTGADRMVFTAALLQQLALPVEPAPADERLLGIGGAADRDVDPRRPIPAGQCGRWAERPGGQLRLELAQQRGQPCRLVGGSLRRVLRDDQARDRIERNSGRRGESRQRDQDQRQKAEASQHRHVSPTPAMCTARRKTRHVCGARPTGLLRI